MSSSNDKKTRQESPLVAVDAVIQQAGQGIVLVQRRYPPFQGYWALPGGMVEIGETVEEALIREVEEETGLVVEPTELIGVFSDPARDPRGHVISIAFLAQIKSGTLHANSDALNAKSFLDFPKHLAFDHLKILEASGAFQSGEDRKTGSVDE
jgi:8-oxo-dGTP diphosphatase